MVKLPEVSEVEDAIRTLWALSHYISDALEALGEERWFSVRALTDEGRNRLLHLDSLGAVKGATFDSILNSLDRAYSAAEREEKREVRENLGGAFAKSETEIPEEMAEWALETSEIVHE